MTTLLSVSFQFSGLSVSVPHLDPKLGVRKTDVLDERIDDNVGGHGVVVEKDLVRPSRDPTESLVSDVLRPCFSVSVLRAPETKTKPPTTLTDD